MGLFSMGVTVVQSVRVRTEQRVSSFHSSSLSLDKWLNLMQKRLAAFCDRSRTRLSKSKSTLQSRLSPWLWTFLLPFSPWFAMFAPVIQLIKSSPHKNHAFFPMMQSPKRHTLVLDLDETLVHTTQMDSMRYDMRVEVNNRRQPFRTFFVRKRPYVDLFLQQMSRHFDIVVFTASLPEYADPVLDMLDSNRVITRRYFREACVLQDSEYVKDLSVVNANLSRVVIVDNSPVAYSMHEANAIPVIPWYEDPRDQELLILVPFLAALRSLHDVRSVLDLRNHPLPEKDFPLNPVA